MVSKKVVRTFENITEEWLRLSWIEDGEEKELVTTPGHQFLAAHGGFREIESLVAGGQGTVVLADGSEAVVTSERIVYSAETADMFEQAEGYVTPENGNLGLKPVYKKGWKTYNFEVEDFHTYVAGGVRVHNDSWNDDKGFEAGAHTGGVGQVWTSSYNGTETGASLDGRALNVDVNDVTDYLMDLEPGYRDSMHARAEAAGYAAANAGYDSASVRAAVVGEYLARGGRNEAPIDIINQDRAYRRATEASAASSGGDQNSGRDTEGARADTFNDSWSTSEGSGGRGDYNNDGEVDADEFNRAEAAGKYDNNNNNSNGNSGSDGGGGGKPVLLDLDGDGLEVTALDRSSVFMDTGGEGFLHRTAWAGEGDGILFYDPDGRDEITEKRQFVFTEWDPTSTSDLEALASVFDSNGDGVLNAGDAEFANFKVMVTNADGSTSAKTLAELGITEIDLTADATNIELSDGSVITGKTTFKRADGTTGTAGDMLLAAEAEGHRVEQVESFDGSGARTLVSTAYDSDGSKAYQIHSVTSADGLSVTNRYDDNGDGVTDRIQTIVTVVNGDGSETETEENFAGNELATAVLQSRTVTTTSADGKSETIERDAMGGGWFNQREVRTEAADGSLTIVISDLAQDGSVINSRSETVSADGSERIDGTDLDGDGQSDTIVTHRVTTHGDDSRTETVTVTNQDTSKRSHVTEEVSADGRSKVIERDLDGDGLIDTREILDIRVAANGQSTSTLDIRNGDGSLKSSSTTVQSNDALTKTTTFDQDGDGDIDLTMVDATTVQADGSRERVITETNGDGSIRSMVRETLGADKVTSETRVDLNQNGSFEADEVVSSVVVSDATGERIATNWSRNADGSVNAKSISTTSSDGLQTVTATDADGDGDTDVTVTDLTTVNGDGKSTRTVTTKNQDGSLKTAVAIETSADGLTVTTRTDVDGDESFEEKTVEELVLEADGGTTRTTETYAGDETTLLSKAVVTETSDRRERTVTVDRDGDGNVQETIKRTINTDGSITVTETETANDGTVLGQTVSETSANGLVTEIARDLDGDESADVTVTTTTTLNADGSRLSVQETENADGSTRSVSQVTVSDDGLKSVTETDREGNGTFERVVTDETVLNYDGSTTRTVESRSQSGDLLSRSQTEISDDQLVTITRTDADGDGSYDLIETTETVLKNDGSTVTTTELRDGDGDLRSGSTQTVSDTARSIVTDTDINGDGKTDTRTTVTIADDGERTTHIRHQDAAGTLQSQSRTVTSANGLSSTTETDRDGDGIYETRSETVRVLNNDGSETTTSTFRGKNGALLSSSAETVRDDGLRTARIEDFDGDGQTDRSSIRQTVIAQDGTVTTTETVKANDGSTLSRVIDTIENDGKSSSREIDADGNGVNDEEITTTVNDDGSTTVATVYKSDSGDLLSGITRSTTGNGLETTVTYDLDGNGSVDRSVSDVTTFADDGGSQRTLTHETGSGRLLGREQISLSDDGLSATTALDLDGVGGNDFLTTRTTGLAHDGSTVESWTTRGANNDLIASATRTTSGDGLNVTENRDVDGDGDMDRETILELGAAGGSTQTVSEYGDETSAGLTRRSTTVTSEDGRQVTTRLDRDGDGDTDLEIDTRVDLSGNETTIWEDLAANGSSEAIITRSASANGTSQTYSLDIDGDGTADITRSTTVSYDEAGNEISTFEERKAVGGLAFTSTTVTSANGLSSTTTVDSDGDGETDSTRETETVFATDGSRTTTSRDWHDDGSLRSSYTETVSADGRTITEVFDFDGDHKTDKVKVTEIATDGSCTVTETGYGETMADAKTAVTSTSSDGLTTTIFRDDVTQEITRSAVGNGSYDWDNGVRASGEAQIFVSHKVDAQGIETWEMHSTLNGVTTVESERFDAQAKARLLAEAARIYDSVLDRDIDLSEAEVLVEFVEDGQLDLEDLASSLLTSDEYATRYGTLSDTGFIARAYQNTFGREPTLDELAEHLAELAGSTTRAAIIADLSESAEHLVVGNSQGETNNYDVFLLPVVAEDELRVSFGVDGVDLEIGEDSAVVGTDNGQTLSIGSNDALFGLGGNDTLGGSSNDDILVGGTGNDTLNGGAGNDTYVYNRGDGNDTINDGGSPSGGDVLRFGAGIELEDLRFYHVSRNEVRLEFVAESAADATAAAAQGLAPLTGSITIHNWNDATTRPIDWLVFENGESVWLGGVRNFGGSGVDYNLYYRLTDGDDTFTSNGRAPDAHTGGVGSSDIIVGAGSNDVIHGKEGHDILYGGAGDDRLYGGEGDDVLDAGSTSGNWQYLYGQQGNDTYLYGKESGRVFINYTENSGTDTVRFKDLTLSDITFATVDYTINNPDSLDKIAIRFLWNDGVSSGELRIADMGNHIERFEFADGTTLSKIHLDIHKRVVLTGIDGADYIKAGALSLGDGSGRFTDDHIIRAGAGD
ncbi:MAG: DUF4214 domain-containing protein, partial [Roseibium sp.]|uniref:DUF4214 domain-containing protein n=1 Tax=Roseibium sp. TaxID=1936156 RepID=UPI0026165D22